MSKHFLNSLLIIVFSTTNAYYISTNQYKYSISYVCVFCIIWFLTHSAKYDRSVPVSATNTCHNVRPLYPCNICRQTATYRLTSGDNYELINRRIGASASAKPYRNNGAVDDDREATKGWRERKSGAPCRLYAYVSGRCTR